MTTEQATSRRRQRYVRSSKSYVDGRAQDALLGSEDARERFDTRKAELLIDVRRLIASDRRDTLGTPESVMLDRRLAEDPRARGAAADDRWFIDQATMYASLRQVEQLDEITRLLGEIIRKLG